MPVIWRRHAACCDPTRGSAQGQPAVRVIKQCRLWLGPGAGRGGAGLRLERSPPSDRIGKRSHRKKEGVTVEELLCHLQRRAKPDWQQYKLPENSGGRLCTSAMSDRTRRPRTSPELRPVITANDSHFVLLNGPAPPRLIPQRSAYRSSCQCYGRLGVAQITHQWGHPWQSQREGDCSFWRPSNVGMQVRGWGAVGCHQGTCSYLQVQVWIFLF